MTKYSVVIGNLGWSNRAPGVEVYGPGGRWLGGPHGDLISEYLNLEGHIEGDRVLTVVIGTRFIEDERLQEIAEKISTLLEEEDARSSLDYRY